MVEERYLWSGEFTSRFQLTILTCDSGPEVRVEEGYLRSSELASSVQLAHQVPTSCNNEASSGVDNPIAKYVDF